MSASDIYLLEAVRLATLRSTVDLPNTAYRLALRCALSKFFSYAVLCLRPTSPSLFRHYQSNTTFL